QCQLAMTYTIGLISGISADAIDAALISLDPAPRVCAHHNLCFDTAMRKRIHSLCEAGGSDEIDRAGSLDNELRELLAKAAMELIAKAGVKPEQIRAIGSHGQTIRHRPPGTLAAPFTWQIADPNIIAARTGITTVADFRRRDLAVGGQGAPLVPAFHAAVFAHPQISRAIVNIGGIGNITWLSAQEPVRGFDTGPGNGLMDSWIGQQLGLAYDADGTWAHSGTVN